MAPTQSLPRCEPLGSVVVPNRTTINKWSVCTVILICLHNHSFGVPVSLRSVRLRISAIVALYATNGADCRKCGLNHMFFKTIEGYCVHVIDKCQRKSITGRASPKISLIRLVCLRDLKTIVWFSRLLRNDNFWVKSWFYPMKIMHFGSSWEKEIGFRSAWFRRISRICVSTEFEDMCTGVSSQITVLSRQSS